MNQLIEINTSEAGIKTVNARDLHAFIESKQQFADWIKARIEQGHSDQWLLFGERSPQHDALYAEQLQHWLDKGQLARCDRAWSRNTAEPHYVQDLVRRHADEIQRWVASGAAIYVCGSLQGMGQGVHAVLQTVLGEAQLEDLQKSGRYRRDVY